MINELDGTRYYSADSNKINLHDSGPYKYQEPEDYFTTLSLGFAVEVGLPSPPTLEAVQAFLPRGKTNGPSPTTGLTMTGTRVEMARPSRLFRP
ncbi:hypothetical protein HDF16_005420 [Granulicella aggregans]|uniref:Uncharacterized protein n=1 Tax=Granulicella aggregans TaxID=474949 RepID=A0A7W7ZIP6_9BACT|nr:hypothetical protein [Granulicella aggregans]MBB5060684.1 hypothetical protein [Granulicella aggregans]